MIIEKLVGHLSFKAFLLGVVCSFAALSFMGWHLSAENIFKDFTRNHRTITNETLFYPTARQIDALIHSKLRPGKVAVIVGGSSVMRGAGQSEEDLWSHYLQIELGEKYQVLNLALNGGGPAGMALYGAEQLIKEGRKVVLVSDLSTAGVGIVPDNGPVYRGLYFDAASRNYTISSAKRNSKIDDDKMNNTDGKYVELSLKSSINKYLNFDEMWNYVGYKIIFTIWTPLTADRPWSPRVSYDDVEPNCDRTNVYKNYLQEEMTILRSLATSKFLGAEVRAAVDYSIPGEFISNVLFVFNSNSPYYIDKLSLDERRQYYFNLNTTQIIADKVGLNSMVQMDGLNINDFCDRVHFSALGGRKLAMSLAPEIRNMAKRLGYVE